MGFQISKRFDFSASHQLAGLPEGHQCGRLHGHNYSVTVVLMSDELNGSGFIKDYGELSCVKSWIEENFEHRHLNDRVAFNPTAELLAQYLYGEFKTELPELAAVIVKETEKTEAVYSPNFLMKL